MSNPLEELQKKLDELGIKVGEEMKSTPKKKKIEGEFVDKQVELFTQMRGLLMQEMTELQEKLSRLEEIKHKAKNGGSNGSC
tara:strand:- start:318 stop:563 length:246 start_codon:yes stop_codon:yes gene_type:complete